MGLARIFGFCFALLFASSVAAAEIIDLGPSDYRSYGSGSSSHTGAGVRSSFGQTVRMPPTLNTLTVTRNPVIPYGSIANGLRNFTRVNPASVAASAAVTALFVAVDWVFDQEQGQWVSLEDETVIDYEFIDNWHPIGRPEFGASSAAQSCNLAVPVMVPNCEITEVRITQGGNAAQCRGMVPTNPRETTCVNLSRVGDTCPLPSYYSLELGGCVIEGEYTPLTSADWQALESSLPSSSADLVASAASDTQRQIGGPLPGYHDTQITGPSSVSGPETTSTSTDPVTGDTVVTTSSTTTNINYGDNTITTTNTTVTNTYTNGQHTGSETTTETPGELPVTDVGGGGAGDWPGFCDWATVLCDWLAWTQEDPPPEQDLPAVIDDDFFEEKRISFGSKSCPPDHEINLAPFLETTVGVSFQPLCDFAGLIYYMVMAASYIIAAYISIGVARNA